MGLTISSIFNKIFFKNRNKIPILMLGLDYAGKSLILHSLCKKVQYIIRSIGFNIEMATTS